ncbi:MAG: hypothetical protein U9N45_01600, partial [Gemmatimonadota bacterium]|nr:hypothetical protein [Gemmatimonadota bacterium]
MSLSSRTFTTVLVILTLLSGLSSSAAPGGREQPLAALVKAAADKGNKPFCIDFSAFSQECGSLPIGVFDSGLGGLTVLAQILRQDSFNNQTHSAGADGRPDFERERFIYLGDQANMPYGNYPAEGKTEFLRELVLKDAVFLLGQRYWPDAQAPAPRFDKPPVKAVVIACNTATAYGLEDLLAAVAEWNIPVYVVGVVRAGAAGAIREMGNRGGAVGVMATVGTCSSKGYVREVEKAARKHGAEATPPVV